MRIAITGEKGFIGTNLAKSIEGSDHTFVSLLEEHSMYKISTGEPCVYNNSENEWERVLSDYEFF